MILLCYDNVDDVLRSVGVLVDALLDRDEELLRRWSCRSLVEGLCEAAEQSM